MTQYGAYLEYRDTFELPLAIEFLTYHYDRHAEQFRAEGKPLGPITWVHQTLDPDRFTVAWRAE